MATGTIYLDVDDEITSAAARIRGSQVTKVALVVPYGSRIATSRMNFRLLAREALVNNRRLSIVAADAATRSLAASAGLPVYSNVAEYDTDAEPGGAGTATGDGPKAPAAGTGPAAAAAGLAASTAAAAATEPAPVGLEASETVVIPPAEPLTPPVRTRRTKKPVEPVSDETQAIELPFAAGPGGAPTSAAATTAAASTAAGKATAPTGPASRDAAGPVRPIAPAGSRVSTGSGASVRRLPALPSVDLSRLGGSAVAIGAAVVLLLVVVGVAAYVFLPAAEITVTPRSEPIGPISLVVRADPDATSVDAENAVVPAERVAVPVEVTDTFTTAGRRIEETAATGSVTFQSYDTSSENTIPQGSVLSTEGGIRFQTTSAVTLPKAQVIPPFSIRPSTADVEVVAAKPGTAGNVPANAITIVPAGEDPGLTKVRNTEETTGGTHEEFPQVAQADVDAALEALAPKLTEAFTTAVEGGEGAPQGATPFPETAVLGDSTPTVDPATLLGQEVATFDLGLRATGTVIAVDDSPVESIAERRLLENVGSDHRLVDGSIEIVPGEPTVESGQVSFPVTARAERVRLLDPADLLARIKGQTVEEARATLAEFGEVKITTWPDWVTSIPGIDSRLSLVVAGQGDAEASGAPSGSPVGSAAP
jgi:hypothetical protein